MNFYRYDLLKDAETYIRLVRLLPRIGDDVLSLQMQHNVSLVKFSPDTIDFEYYAASYEWGSNRATRRVNIDGAVLNISQNLHDFLTALYDHHAGVSSGWFWIDSICINQDDIAERSQQICLMKDVYSSAKQVLVWLGQSNNEYDRDVFDACNWIESDLSGRLELSTIMHPDLFDDIYGDDGPLDIYENELAVEALEDLCRRKYWTRLWILQEIVLAKEVVLICGQYKTRLESFVGTCGQPYVDDGDIMNDTEYTQFKRVINFFRARTVYAYSQIKTPSLLHVVQYLAGADCEVLHDRVYGFLGLASGAIPMKVDYVLPLTDLFLSVLAAAAGACTLEGCYELAQGLGIKIRLDATGQIFINSATVSQTGAALNLYLISAPSVEQQSSHVKLDNVVTLRTTVIGVEEKLYERVMRHYKGTCSSGHTPAFCNCTICARTLQRSTTTSTSTEKGISIHWFHDLDADSGLYETPSNAVIFEDGEYAATVFWQSRNSGYGNSFVIRDPLQSTWILRRQEHSYSKSYRGLEVDMPMASVLFMLSYMLDERLQAQERVGVCNPVLDC